MPISQDFLFILQHQNPLFLKNLIKILAAKRLSVSSSEKGAFGPIWDFQNRTTGLNAFREIWKYMYVYK